ncbi:MAG: reverse transcriptase domain-containing protein, partial [Aeromonas sp.]
SHLSKYCLLSNSQHGFREKRSCLSNLLGFLELITQRLDNGHPVEVCYLDFRKAFDSVNHRLLEAKLRNFGITGVVLQWISNFLKERTFRVRVGTALSQEAAVTSGVPQGSVLGPLLFILFIDDLARKLESSAFVFADDIKIVGDQGTPKLIADLEIVLGWSKSWDLPLNTDKCQLLSTVSKTLCIPTPEGLWNLTSEHRIKDLGILVNCDLKWHDQCIKSTNAARAALFKLRSVITNRKPEILLPLYKALVRPHLEYCIQAWSPYLQKDIYKLESVQRLATRMMEGQKHKSYAQRLIDLNLFSLERRRLRGDLIEVFKMTHGYSGVDPNILKKPEESTTRGHRYKLSKQHSRLECRRNFFALRIVDFWNKLPQELVEVSTVAAFKKALDGKWEYLFPSYYP